MIVKKKLILFTLIALLLGGVACEKEKMDIRHTTGYIACFIGYGYSNGCVVISEDLKDTLLTFNVADFKQPTSIISPQTKDTIYLIHPWYEVFPDSTRYKYKIDITYIEVAKKDKFYPVIPASYPTTIHVDKQIIVKTISKL